SEPDERGETEAGGTPSSTVGARGTSAAKGTPIRIGSPAPETAGPSSTRAAPPGPAARTLTPPADRAPLAPTPPVAAAPVERTAGLAWTALLPLGASVFPTPVPPVPIATAPAACPGLVLLVPAGAGPGRPAGAGAVGPAETELALGRPPASAGPLT